MSAEHEIEIFDPPKRIRHPSGKNRETMAPLYAEWSIEARGGGKTTLCLVHSGFSVGADWDDEFEAHARGWKLMLQNLRHYFERHAHEPAAHLPFMSNVESPRGSIWKALLAKLGSSAQPKVGDRFLHDGEGRRPHRRGRFRVGSPRPRARRARGRRRAAPLHPDG